MSKSARNRVYLRAREVVDIATGEHCLGLVPATVADVAKLRERHLQPGQVLRADLARPRNLSQWRRAHLLGALVLHQCPGFEALDAHGAIKRLQVDSGVGCDLEAITVPGVGVLERRLPRSLAFDEMDEGEFRQVWLGLCRHLIATYWPTLAVEDVERMAELMPRGAL